MVTEFGQTIILSQQKHGVVLKIKLKRIQTIAFLMDLNLKVQSH